MKKLNLALFSLLLTGGVSAGSFRLEGSSWGTEDALQRALQLNESEIPERFKIPLEQALNPVDMKERLSAKDLFADDRVFLYSKIRVCFFPEILSQIPASLVQTAKEFSHSLVMREAKIDFEFKIGNRNCDLIFARGKWEEYPYSVVRPNESDDSQVYGIFWRSTQAQVPVVFVRPELKIDFSKVGVPYLRHENNELLMEGKAFVFHEVGHLLGWDHLSSHSGSFQHPEATLMGLKASERDEHANAFRFWGAQDLWKFPDYFQSTVYKREWYRRYMTSCPLLSSDPIVDNPSIQEKLEEFYSVLENRVPDIRSKLTAHSVRELLLRDLWQAPNPMVCSLIKELLAGKWPKGVKFHYQAPTSGWDEQEIVLKIVSDNRRPIGISHPRHNITVFTTYVRAFPEPDYLCLQEGETLYMNLPYFATTSNQLNDFFDLPMDWVTRFGESFVKLPTGESLLFKHDNYEEEISLKHVRTQGFESRLYTWIGLKGEGRGVIEDFEIELSPVVGNPVKSRKYHFNVRSDFASCLERLY